MTDKIHTFKPGEIEFVKDRRLKKCSQYLLTSLRKNLRVCENDYDNPRPMAWAKVMPEPKGCQPFHEQFPDISKFRGDCVRCLALLTSPQKGDTLVVPEEWGGQVVRSVWNEIRGLKKHHDWQPASTMPDSLIPKCKSIVVDKVIGCELSEISREGVAFAKGGG